MLDGICYNVNRQNDMSVPVGATKAPEMAVSGAFFRLVV